MPLTWKKKAFFVMPPFLIVYSYWMMIVEVALCVTDTYKHKIRMFAFNERDQIMKTPIYYTTCTSRLTLLLGRNSMVLLAEPPSRPLPFSPEPRLSICTISSMWDGRTWVRTYILMYLRRQHKKTFQFSSSSSSSVKWQSSMPLSSQSDCSSSSSYPPTAFSSVTPTAPKEY